MIIRIAIATIALSVSVMIVASAMIHGFKKEISQKIFDFGGHIQITEAFTNPILEGTPMQYEAGLIDSIKEVKRVTYEWPLDILGFETNRYVRKRTRGGVKYVYRYIQYPAVLTTREDMEGLILKGVSDDFPGTFFDRYLQDGTGLSLNDSLATEILVSQVTALRLHLSVGDRVNLYFIKEGPPRARRFTVTGIYKTGLAEYDKKFALIDMGHLQDILDWSPEEVTGIEVVLDDIDDLPIMNEYLNLEVLPTHLYTRSIRQVASSIFDWLDLQDINEVIILGLMLLVCVINMITALLILILERTHMIGVLKALGSTNWQIRKIFVRQAGHILLKGLAIGNLVGLGLCYLQKNFQFIKLREEDYYLAVAPIDFSVSTILIINLGTFIITILFLILPSYFISRILPTRALRFN
ncbi:MAG: ABC transporter permease [Saprospiraceae bacterium]|nr:ABC transporter permease [Saprospiraceae bacterium]